MEYYKATAKQLYEELERLQYSENNPSNRANKAIQLISTTMQLLRKAVQERGFDKEEDEIEFFKHVKPQINGHLIFYRHIFDIEAKRIAYTEEEIEHCIAEKKKKQQQQQQQLLRQQSLNMRTPGKPTPYEPGTCAKRLTHYIYHEQNRPQVSL